MKQVGFDHSKADSLIKDTQNLLEEIRSFTVQKDIVTYPSEERCVVAETPELHVNCTRPRWIHLDHSRRVQPVLSTT